MWPATLPPSQEKTGGGERVQTENACMAALQTPSPWLPTQAQPGEERRLPAPTPPRDTPVGICTHMRVDSLLHVKIPVNLLMMRGTQF